MSALSVLICTLNDRITTVPRILLPECEDVRYVISFQYTDDLFLDMIPESLRSRRDVSIHSITETGLSRNRNNALRNCTTPFALVCDDDTPFTAETLRGIFAAFLADTSLDVVVVDNCRLAFRVSERIPHFDTRFGLGSAYLSCGEEEVLLHQAKTYGLSIRHLSFDAHFGERRQWAQMRSEKRVRRSWGALQYMKHSTIVAFFRILYKVFHLRSAHYRAVADEAPFTFRERWTIFCDMLDGLRYIVTHPLNDSIAEEIPLDFQPIDIWRMP